MILATIPGKPMGEPRPRATTIGGHARLYTPKESTSYRAMVAHFVRDAMAGARPLTGPVRLTIDAFRACPKTDERKREPRPQRRWTTKPDASNVAKIVEDALNGVAWIDDAQVAELVVRKWTAAQGEAPRVEVRIEEAMA